jgi:hypothetical protein
LYIGLAILEVKRIAVVDRGDLLSLGGHDCRMFTAAATDIEHGGEFIVSQQFVKHQSRAKLFKVSRLRAQIEAMFDIANVSAKRILHRNAPSLQTTSYRPTAGRRLVYEIIE